jgi:hypothetical protein
LVPPIFTRLSNNFIPEPEHIPQNIFETTVSAAMHQPDAMKLIPGFDTEGAP